MKIRKLTFRWGLAIFDNVSLPFSPIPPISFICICHTTVPATPISHTSTEILKSDNNLSNSKCRYQSCTKEVIMN